MEAFHPSLLLFGICLSLVLLAGCNSQSTCAFMKQLNYLSLKHIPDEPMDGSGMKYCSPLKRSTCCTIALEAEMKNQSLMKLEVGIRRHIDLVRNFFDDSRQSFQENLQAAISDTHEKLDSTYRRTYGSFYSAQPPNSPESPVKIFNDSFLRLRSHLDFTDEMEQHENYTRIWTSRMDAFLETIDDLFNRTYVLEFLLMNPLMDADDKQRQCMIDLIPTLRPFGSIPEKIKLMIGRGFETWTTLLSTLRRISTLLGSISQKYVLPDHCSGPLTRMTQCHLCSGESPSTRPCFSLCLNILKGCLSTIAEIDPQFNRLLDSLINLSSRLKSVHNPYNLLLPLPFQISEAVMHFQVMGTTYSNRITLRCFQFDYHLRRQPSPEQEARRGRRSLSVSTSYHLQREDDSNSASNVITMKTTTADFIDMLSRLRGFWKLLPRLFCQEDNIAAADWDYCWNGTSLAPYRRSLARNGLDATRYNPEFYGLIDGIILGDDHYRTERGELIVLSNQLDALHDIAEPSSEDFMLTSLENLSDDDEDYAYDEGSGQYESGSAERSSYEQSTYGNSTSSGRSLIFVPFWIYLCSAFIVYRRSLEVFF